MTTTEPKDQEVRHQQNPQTQDQTGALAESARRHIAYERLARQVAASEAAARLVLAALARAGQGAEDSQAEDSQPETTPHPALPGEQEGTNTWD